MNANDLQKYFPHCTVKEENQWFHIYLGEEKFAGLSKLLMYEYSPEEFLFLVKELSKKLQRSTTYLVKVEELKIQEATKQLKEL